MTDISATLPRPKIPVWRTAYDGYRLGIGAIFSSGAMFRFFVYGSVSLVAVFGVFLYGNLSMSGLLANASPGSNQTLVIGSSFLLGIALYALIAAIQTPLGVAVQRFVLLGRFSQAFILLIFDRPLWPSIFLGVDRCLCLLLYRRISLCSDRILGLPGEPIRSDWVFRHACRQSLCIDDHHVNLDHLVRSRQLVGDQNQLCIRNCRYRSSRFCHTPGVYGNSRHHVASFLYFLPGICSTFPCLHGRRYRSDD